MTNATAAPNVTPHLLFDDEGNILCGAQNHYAKRPKAKRVNLDVWTPTRMVQPEEGTYALARDGMKVTVGTAHCGTHLTSSGRSQALSMTPEMVVDLRSTPALLLDYVQRKYEKYLDDEAARQAADKARWDAHRQRDHAEVVFTARRNPARFRGAVAAWLIEGTHPNVRDGEPFPMTNVEVNNDGGVLWVTTSDFMNSGPGRGNPSWLAALLDALQQAAEVQRKGASSTDADRPS